MSKPILILDVDGVLIHGRVEDGLRWDTNLTKDMGMCSKHLQTHFFPKYWGRVITGQHDLFDALGEYLSQHDIPHRVQDVVDYWFAHDSALDKTVLEFVDQIKGQFSKICLATNQEKYRCEYLWKNLELNNFFDEIYYSGDLGCQKPEQNFYAKVTETLGVKSDNILFWDDARANVNGAKDFGWQAYHYQSLEDMKSVLSPPQ